MYDMFVMDMGGHDINVQNILTLYPHAQVVRYYDNHLSTIRRCVARAKTPSVWIVSSCCIYFHFDFSYKAKPWEAYQIHCWPSGRQKFGDTFLINVAEFNKQKDIGLLEWYKDINWHSEWVPRAPWPTLECPTEDLTSALKAEIIDTPYVWLNGRVPYDVFLWKDRSFVTFNSGGSVSLAPREIKGHLQTQIYDYPFINKQKDIIYGEKLLDIIYISNGEPDAEQWYNHLVDLTQRPVARVQNVVGRTAAYKAAARLSETPWFFAVFAKLEVLPGFNFAWQPDYLQEPKHYIFHSKNPVNGLEYGHMGVIAYNKQLVLDTVESGLDFTLSKPHAVIPVISAIAHYNTTPELTWRTAFREVIKLKDDVEKTNSVASNHRLQVWLEVAEGDYASWSKQGALDAIEYYNSVSGDYDKLKLSYDWLWLTTYYSNRYSA